MKSNKTRLANDASTAPSSIGSSRMGYRVRSALKSLVRDAMKQEILMDDARFLRRIRFEPLERRELMAADFFEATSNSSQSPGRMLMQPRKEILRHHSQRTAD